MSAGREGRPNCYGCVYRGSVPGSVHSSCQHPVAKKDANPMGELMSIFASVGRAAPTLALDAAVELGIRANPHGVMNGWFNWPYNFDPTWLEACDGYTEKPAVRAPREDAG